MYRAAFNFSYRLTVLVMHTPKKNTFTVIFIIAATISLIQSANNITAEKDTNTNTSSAYIPDEKGIMMYDYGRNIGKVYNPLIIAQGGQKYHQDYLIDSNDNKSKEYFLNTADWLVNHAEEKEFNGIRYSLWAYHFPWPFYKGLNPPYSSALAQSAGIQILIWAHSMTGDKRYLDAADKAFGSFLVDYDKGGVISEGEIKDNKSEVNTGNSIFLQEIAKPGYPKTYVLNGHIFSLIDIWNYYEYTHNENASIVFNKGLKALKDNLWRYDTNKWSYYDQIGHLASTGYQKIHVEQLAKLYRITDEPLLKDYSDKFARYLSVAQNTENITALNNKGISLANIGKINESIMSFDKALEIDPTNVATLNNKGFALAKLGKYNESIALYDKALEIDPTYVLALNNKNTAVKALASRA